MSRKPLAPALSAAKAYSSRSKVVRMSTCGASGSGLPSSARQIRRVACTPSSRGIRTSMRITSTSVCRSFSTAWAPSPASAAISMSPCDWRIIRNPVRSSSWSSTSITRMVMGGS